MARLRLRARPRLSLVPTLACAALIALTIGLGNWQSGRAKEKDVTEARHAQTREAAELAVGGQPVAVEQVDGRRVMLRGSFEPALAVYWDNQIVNRVPGFGVIVPFRLAGSDMRVLIDRGLLRATADRHNLPPITAPAGEVELHGRAYLAPRRTIELKEGVREEELRGRLWQNVRPEQFAAAHKLAVQPFLLRESSAVAGSASPAVAAPQVVAPSTGMASAGSASATYTVPPPAAAATPAAESPATAPAAAPAAASATLPPPAGLLRMTDNTGLPAETGMTAAKHRGYAFQWYSLAALAALLFLLFTFLTYDDAASDA